MATLQKGSFTLNLGIVQLSGELSEEDRQCAWEIYTEIATRVAVSGKSGDEECTDFGGELLVESLDSLYSFFQEARRIMRRFPVGRIPSGMTEHLGVLISRILTSVLRPFLEEWQVELRYWWEHESNPRLAPVTRQEAFPRMEELKREWSALRWIMRQVETELREKYELVDVHPAGR